MASGPARVLILGGAGYFGARLAERLAEGAEVTVTSRSASPGREAWLERQAGRVRLVRFDSAAQSEIAVEGAFDAVLNLATPGAAECAANPDASLAAATRTMDACLGLLRSGRAGRLVHFSSFHVYGAHGQARFAETDEPRPLAPYGRIHRHCEEALLSVDAPAPVLIARPTNMVGAPAHPDLGPQAGLLFLDLCRQAARAGALSLRSDGKAYRDFVPMTDALQAASVLLQAPAASTTLVNLAAGTSASIEEVAGLVRDEASRRLGREVPVTFGAGGDSYRSPFTVTNDRLRALGWRPEGDLRREIRETLEFFLREGAA